MGEGVLVVSPAADAHARAVQQELARRGRRAVLFDFGLFPRASQIALLTADPARSVIRGPAGSCELGALGSVYIRHAGPTHVGEGLRAEARAFARQESYRALETLLRCLPLRVVNSYEAIIDHRHKPFQSMRVAALGVPVPRTLISNAPDEVARFFEEQGGEVVIKPSGGGACARRLTREDLARRASIAACPMQYQELVEGSDVRVFVIGAEAFAARILTSRPGHIDFRTDPGHSIERISLGSEEIARCQSIASALGLAFTAIDFRERPDGLMVFLEANPSPMFLRFQRDTGHPILERLVDLL